MIILLYISIKSFTFCLLKVCKYLWYMNKILFSVVLVEGCGKNFFFNFGVVLTKFSENFRKRKLSHRLYLKKNHGDPSFFFFDCIKKYVMQGLVLKLLKNHCRNVFRSYIFKASKLWSFVAVLRRCPLKGPDECKKTSLTKFIIWPKSPYQLVHGLISSAVSTFLSTSNVNTVQAFQH